MNVLQLLIALCGIWLDQVYFVCMCVCEMKLCREQCICWLAQNWCCRFGVIYLCDFVKCNHVYCI